MFRNFDWSFSSSAEAVTACMLGAVVVMLVALVI